MLWLAALTIFSIGFVVGVAITIWATPNPFEDDEAGYEQRVNGRRF